MKKIFRQRKGLMAIGLFAIWLAASSCGGSSRGVPALDRNANTPATGATISAEQAKLQLGSFQELQGTDFLIAPIGTPLEREYSLKGSDTGFTRNYLFVNLSDKSSHLLLPTNDFLILTFENLLEKPPALPANPAAKNAAQPSEGRAPEPTENPVKWICYRVVKADTDGDKYLTANDLITIALSDASGFGYTELIADVQAVLHETRRGDSLIFLYKASGQNHIAEINLQTKQVNVTKELQEIVPK